MNETKQVSRWGVLLSMPEQERFDALFDEMVYGQFYAEHRDGRFRRLEHPAQRKPPDYPTVRCFV